MTITEFLLARIAEDEAVGRDWRHLALAGHDKVSIYGGGDGYVQLVNPARVLAECAAKRAIVQAHPTQIYSGIKGQEVMECLICERFPCDTLQALGAVYANHQDYDPEWAF